MKTNLMIGFVLLSVVAFAVAGAMLANASAADVPQVESTETCPIGQPCPTICLNQECGGACPNQNCEAKIASSCDCGESCNPSCGGRCGNLSCGAEKTKKCNCGG